MLFRKLKSTTLLKAADNADTAAQGAFAVAQQLHASAAAKRALAARVEAEEKAERLEAKVIAAELLVTQIGNELSAYEAEQKKVEGALTAVVESRNRAALRLADEQKMLTSIKSLARAARMAVSPVETKDGVTPISQAVCVKKHTS